MFAPFRSVKRRRVRAADAAVDLPWDDLLADARSWPVGQRADCCVATAAYRVVLPAASPTGTRPELLLCQHHLRATAAGRARSRALVYDIDGHLVSDSPAPSAPSARAVLSGR